MSSNAALTEPITLKKFFKWTINNFNKFSTLNMNKGSKRIGNGYDTTYFIESSLMTATDPYDGKQYTEKFKLTSKNVHQNFSIVPPVLPTINSAATYQCYFTINDDPKEFSTTDPFQWTDDIKKLTIYADLMVHRSFFVPTFAKKPQKNLANRLTEIWKNDSSVRYTIKCGEICLKLQPQNFVEIDEFEVETVQKMIEFCETDNIKDVNGCECDLFRIAHKFQINDLMKFSIEKMSENVNTSSVFGYLQLATTYNLKDFEEWCMNFAFPSNV